ncbi:quinone oxidoreductase [Sphingobacterium sp. 18053]|uniref:quinone oxidoreductase family protein n=1 Tax=Sphingobacterium sp. 18053 TaxID=2681401 RepID=UPI00135BF82E|nr:quinone oxidoreductase [Sphingobacterium sp. 18053]
MSTVVKIYNQGSPDVLTLEEQKLETPRAGEVKIRQEAIGVNFVDVYMRNGYYGIPHIPFTLGVEGAGIVEEVGGSETKLKKNDRVAYFFSPGAYAEHRLIKETALIKIPDDISFEVAATILAKGLTARMLIKQVYQLKPSDTILVHAASGGVGTLLVRWAKSLKAKVIAVVGSSAKIEHAKNSGADVVLLSSSKDFAQQVLDATNGKGVDVVYDGIAGYAFPLSIQSVRTGGKIFLFGFSGGDADTAKYSQEIINKQIELDTPAIGMYVRQTDVLEEATADLFATYRSGILGTAKPTSYSLSDVVQVHKDLEARVTTGSVIMKP